MDNEDDFLKYCEELDKPEIEKTAEVLPQEGNYSFKIEKYVFLRKQELIAMFCLLDGGAVGALVQVDLRNEQPVGNVYASLDTARNELDLALDTSKANGWTVGYVGLRNYG